jgi:DNA-binding beta-propeller fold protein YncE
MRKKIELFFILALGCLSLLQGDQTPNTELGKKGRAYISNLMSHTVSVIDLDAMRWLRDLNFGRYPIFSSLHPHDKTKMILALHNYDRTEDEDVIALIDLKTEKILKKVPFPGPGLPSGFVYDKKRDRIYIADENLHKVFALDGKTLDLIFEFPAGLIPVHVDISPDCRWLVATNRKSANLYVYDLDNILRNAKDGIYTIPLGPSPGLLWDTEASGTTVFSHPLDVKFGRDNEICYVTDYSTRELLVVDIKTQKITGRIPFNKTPFDFTLNKKRSLAFICHVNGDAISVVDLNKKAIIAEIPDIAPNPIHCELDEERGILIVACWGDYQKAGIHIIDLKTYKVLKSIFPEGAKASIGITIAQSAN